MLDIRFLKQSIVHREIRLAWYIIAEDWVALNRESAVAGRRCV